MLQKMEKKKIMKVAIYVRVSKAEKDPKGRQYQEPMNQLEPLKKFCDDMKWKIKYEFVERASGANSNRPEFQKLMAEARQHHFDLVLVWALDRFSREPILNTLKYIEDLKKHNVFLKSFTENIDTREEGVSELIMIILVWLSAEERKRISKRTKASIQRLKNLGVYKGGRPKKK